MNRDVPFSLAEQALLQLSRQLSRAQTLAPRTASPRAVAWTWPALPCPAQRVVEPRRLKGELWFSLRPPLCEG